MAHVPAHCGQLWRTSLHIVGSYGAPPCTLWAAMAHLPAHCGQLWRTSLDHVSRYGAPPCSLWVGMVHIPAPCEQVWCTSMHIVSRYGVPPWTLWVDMTHCPVLFLFLCNALLILMTLYLNNQRQLTTPHACLELLWSIRPKQGQWLMMSHLFNFYSRLCPNVEQKNTNFTYTYFDVKKLPRLGEMCYIYYDKILNQYHKMVEKCMKNLSYMFEKCAKILEKNVRKCQIMSNNAK